MSVARSSRRRVVTAMVTAGVAVSTSALAAPFVSNAMSSDCATTFNLFIPGTWETDEKADPARPVGMLRPIAEAVQRQHGADSVSYFIPYMARAFDNGYTYADSKNTALTNARSALRAYRGRCPAARFTLTGYSQGADAAGDLASDIGNDLGPIPADRVVAVGLLADPRAGTEGESVIGPRPFGSGIADPRPRGMGRLAGRVSSICDPKDLYCSIEKSDNPLLGLLGSILSRTFSGAGPAPGNPPLAEVLTTNFARADLPGLEGALAALTAGVTASGGLDLPEIRGAADALRNTVDPLAELASSGAVTEATIARLTGAPPGSPEHNAGTLLREAGRSDLPRAAAAARTIIDRVAAALGTGVERLPANSPVAGELTAAVHALAAALEPVTSTPADIRGSASKVLAMLAPSAVFDQVLAIVTTLGSLDLPGIMRNLALLPQRLAALDMKGAHAVAGELNNQFQPLVKLAAAVDLKWMSQVLRTVPEQSGYTAGVTQVTSTLSTVDVPRLAQTVGRIQEVAWTALEKLIPPPGQPADPAGAEAALAELLPLAAELLGTEGGLGNAAQRLDLPALTDALAGIATAKDIDLTALIGDGLSAVSFFASGAHINYGSLVVDDKGRNAIQWLGDWLNEQIGHAG